MIYIKKCQTGTYFFGLSVAYTISKLMITRVKIYQNFICLLVCISHKLKEISDHSWLPLNCLRGLNNDTMMTSYRWKYCAFYHYTGSIILRPSDMIFFFHDLRALSHVFIFFMQEIGYKFNNKKGHLRFIYRRNTFKGNRTLLAICKLLLL